MSRSFKKTPITSFCVVNHSVQAKWLKKQHRMYRRYVKQELKKEKYDELMPFDKYSDIWDSPSDGFQYGNHIRADLTELEWKKDFKFK